MSRFGQTLPRFSLLRIGRYLLQETTELQKLQTRSTDSLTNYLLLACPLFLSGSQRGRRVKGKVF